MCARFGGELGAAPAPIKRHNTPHVGVTPSMAYGTHTGQDNAPPVGPVCAHVRAFSCRRRDQGSTFISPAAAVTHAVVQAGVWYQGTFDWASEEAVHGGKGACACA